MKASATPSGFNSTAGSAPGVPLSEGYRRTPGISVPDEGYVVPSDAPGFGIELTLDEVEAVAS